MKVLVIEDDTAIASVLTKMLEAKKHNVTCVDDGLDALEEINRNHFDFILLDIMLPGLNGVDVLRRIRKNNIKIPVILLTAIGTSASVVEGLNAGADDYLVKPFKLEELIARIQAVLRRGQNFEDSPSKDVIYQLNDIVLNDTTKKVQRADQEIKLTSKEFNLLKYFLKNKNKVLSREKILEDVWDINFNIGTNVVDVYINYVRKKLRKDQSDKIIETVVGMGYAMREE